MKPVIGINAHYKPEPGLPAIICARETYIESVAGAGGIPVMLPMISELESRADVLDRQLEACDGVVLIGGPDVDPARYGETDRQDPPLATLVKVREDYDFALIDRILAARKPFLAICLGCQELNVALGGTLRQDIAREVETAVSHSRADRPYENRHATLVEKDSRVGRLLRASVPRGAKSTPTSGTCFLADTNSAHHQAVLKLGAGLRATAWCAGDNVVEAIELEDYPFGLGIQWHPEYLQGEPFHKSLFTALVAASVEERSSRLALAR